MDERVDIDEAAGDTVALEADDASTETAAPRLPAGARVSRFVVIESIGHGGMGTLYRAYDPQLDRSVALKLVRFKQGKADVGAVAEERLLGEARALARLSHPHVVAVYEAGTFDGRVFVAMEYVEGRTLRAWAKEEPRSMGDLLNVLVPAGHGLEAAHRSGLVHRDVKPDNVLYGQDGRVRVIDFGLARGLDGAAALSESTAASLSSSGASGGYASPSGPPSDLSSSQLATGESRGARMLGNLTRNGVVVGTPRYMAPEQFEGLPADARSDQFAFGVMVYELLYGTMPFEGASLRVLRRNVTLGRFTAAPPGTQVPPWMRRAVLRALAAVPGERYPSVGAFLDALQNDPAARRRAWIRRGAVTLATGAVLAFGVSARWDRTPVCGDGKGRAEAVWNEATKARVQHAFLSTGRAFAPDTFERVAKTFDGYATAWASQHREACEATRLRGEQSPELLDLRMTCLADRLESLKAQVEVLTTADDTTLERGVAAAHALPRLEACGDAAALRAKVPVPANPATRARVDDIVRGLARSRALNDAGRVGEALAVAEDGWTAAAGLPHGPTQAEALYALGSAQQAAAKYEDAAVTLRKSAILAHASRHDAVASEAWMRLLMILAEPLSQLPAARGLLDVTDAAAQRAAGDTTSEGEYTGFRSRFAVVEGKLDEALAFAEQSLAQRRAALGEEHPQTARALVDVGRVQTQRGHYAEAETSLVRALELEQRIYGPSHPEVVGTQQELGVLLRRQGRYDDALRYFAGALEIRERNLGPDHPEVASSLNNVGSVENALEHYNRALVAYRRALTIVEAHQGADHKDVALIVYNIGNVLLHQGQPEEAEAAFTRVLAVFRKALGEDHPHTVSAFSRVAVAVGAQGRWEEATSLHRRALALREHVLGAAHPDVASTLVNLAEAEVEAHHPAAAIEHLQRARAIQDQTLSKDHDHRGDLALVLAEAHRAEARFAAAIPEAELARSIFAKAVGETSPSVGDALFERGLDELGVGQSHAAIATLEGALAIRDRPGGDPLEAARVRLALATAIASDSGDGGPEHARDLAERARHAMVPLGPRAQRWVAETDVLLRTLHGRTKG